MGGGGSLKVTLAIDGETRSVEVDLAGPTASFGGATHPVRIVSSSGSRVELEIAGERVVVDGWPSELVSPPERVSVEGESYRVHAVVAADADSARSPRPGGAKPIPVAIASALTGPDVIVPPMPGKVIEVRVREGDRVEMGAVLLVLEAMKMRNEVTSPRAGVVRNLVVTAGSSVGARAPMLSVVPEGE